MAKVDLSSLEWCDRCFLPILIRALVIAPVFARKQGLFLLLRKIFENFSFRGSINEPSRCLPIEGQIEN